MSQELPKPWAGVMAFGLMIALGALIVICINNSQPEPPEKCKTRTLDDTSEEIEARKHRKEHPEAWDFRKY